MLKKLLIAGPVPIVILLTLVTLRWNLDSGTAAAGDTERVSVDSSGVQGNDDSESPHISADGRFVIFDSSANDLVLGDTNNTGDVFVHDRQTGTTERVSVDSAGIQGNDLSDESAISANGRYIAFQSDADNLVAGDTNGAPDVFVHDRVTGATERVSVDSADIQGNGESEQPAISADGRYVAFGSLSDNLVSGDTNGVEDVFVHDRQTGVTHRVSVDSAGTQGDGNSYNAAISADGRYVAFGSVATNLVQGDTNGKDDVFVHDRLTGATERISVDSAGIQGNNLSYSAAISADGRYIAFQSDADNLVSGDTNIKADVFVHDRQTGATERDSVDSAGVQGNNTSYSPVISADGRYVAFTSSADNLVPGDTNGTSDVFVHDRGAVATPTPVATPTRSPSPSPSPAATPTPTHTPTPSPTAGTSRIWGDGDCSGDIGPRDAQAVLKNVLVQDPLSQTQPCPAIGAQVTVDGVSRIWSDWDCGGDIGPRDAQAVLKNVLVQDPLSQTQPCPPVGSTVQVVG